jgi:hypothetical protein
MLHRGEKRDTDEARQLASVLAGDQCLLIFDYDDEKVLKREVVPLIDELGAADEVYLFTGFRAAPFEFSHNDDPDRLHAPAMGVHELGMLVTTGLPVLGTIIGAWLGAHNSRKVRIKVGDIEAEAGTVEELERLLTRAQEIKQASEPNTSHE